MEVRIATIAVMIIVAFTDNIVGNCVYYYLVKTKGGGRIYKPIEKVDGFLLKTTYGGAGELYSNELLSNKLKYLEEYVTEANPRANSDTRKFTTEKGFYRMYVSDVGDKNCKTNMKDTGSFEDRHKVRKDDDKCVAYIKIDKPASKYSVKHGEWENMPLLITVGTSNTQVIDMRNNEKIAEFTGIKYVGGFLLYGMFDGKVDPKFYPKDNKDNELRFVKNIFTAQ
jgi:hypothetical protein